MPGPRLTLRIASVDDNILTHVDGSSSFDTTGCGHTIKFEYLDSNSVLKTSFDGEDKAFLKDAEIRFQMSFAIGNPLDYYPKALTNITVANPLGDVYLTHVVRNLVPGTVIGYAATLGSDEDALPLPIYVKDSQGVDTDVEATFTVKTIPDINQIITIDQILSATSALFTHEIPIGAARGWATTVPMISYSYAKDGAGQQKSIITGTRNLTQEFTNLDSVLYNFQVTFRNQVGWSVKNIPVFPTDVPNRLGTNDVTIKSNLELATDKSAVDGGVTVFYNLPSNLNSLKALGSPIITVKIDLLRMKLNAAKTAYDVVDTTTTVEVPAVNFLTPNSTLAGYVMQYTFSEAQVTLGTSVKARVTFTNNKDTLGKGWSPFTGLAMSMKLASDAEIKYHVIQGATDCALDLYRVAEPLLHGASAPTDKYRVYRKIGTANELASENLAFEEIFEDNIGVFIGRNTDQTFIVQNGEDRVSSINSTTNVRTASSVSSVQTNGEPVFLDGVRRLYKKGFSGLTAGSVYRFRVCTLSKSPHSDDIFESPGFSQTIYAKKNVGSVDQATITGSPVDSNGIPLTIGTDPAVNISFDVPAANNVDLNGGAKGAVSFVLLDQHLEPINGADALPYPTVSTNRLSWTVAQPLGQQCNYHVVVRVMDEQKTTKQNAQLPTVSPTPVATLGTRKTLSDQRSIAYLPAVTNLTFTRGNTPTSMNLSWNKQELPPAQVYLFTDFKNVLVVVDDETGTTVGTATEILHSAASQITTVTGLTAGRKYSAHMIPKQKYSATFDKIMKNSTTISFVAGSKPSAPANVISYPAKASIVLDWDKVLVTLTGGTLGNYEIAAIKDVVAINATIPAFPLKQNWVNVSAESYATVIQAYPSPDAGYEGVGKAFIINDVKYKVAVRSTSVLSSNVVSVPVTYESLRLVGVPVNNETLVSDWSSVVEAVPNDFPKQPKTVTVLSTASNVFVSWEADTNQEFIVFNDDDAYFKSSTFAQDGDSGVSRLQDSSAPLSTLYSFSEGNHKIQCPRITKDLKIFNVSQHGVLSDLPQTVSNVSAMATPGVVREPKFEVLTATSCAVSFKAPEDMGAAGKTIYTAKGPITNDPLMYEITVETLESSNYVVKKKFNVSALSTILDNINITGSTIFIAIKAYYMQPSLTPGESATAVAGLKVYVNRLNSTDVKQGIRLGPSPQAGLISNILATSTTNRISFDYSFPSEAKYFPYPINSLQVKVFDGQTQIGSTTSINPTTTGANFAYDESKTIELSSMKYGKSYKIQVQPIGNYLYAQNPPLSEIPVVVPYKKMEISSITKSGNKYTCNVDLNGDDIQHITAISKPVDLSGPLSVSTPLTQSSTTMRKTGLENTTHAADQNAILEFTIANSSAALVIVSGKTFDIKDHPENSFGAVIP